MSGRVRSGVRGRVRSRCQERRRGVGSVCGTGGQETGERGVRHTRDLSITLTRQPDLVHSDTLTSAFEGNIYAHLFSLQLSLGLL